MRGPQPWRTNRAAALRSQRVRAEVALWSHLRNRQLGDYKFIRQAPIGDYFADFLCRELKVVVEVDGGTHGTDEELASDASRSAEFERLGYCIFRVRNDDVYRNMAGVLDGLLAFLRNRAGER